MCLHPPGHAASFNKLRFQMAYHSQVALYGNASFDPFLADVLVSIWEKFDSRQVFVQS